MKKHPYQSTLYCQRHARKVKQREAAVRKLKVTSQQQKKNKLVHEMYRTTNACLGFRCRLVTLFGMSFPGWMCLRSNVWSKRWFRFCFSAWHFIAVATVGIGFGLRSILAGRGATTINAMSNTCTAPKKNGKTTYFHSILEARCHPEQIQHFHRHRHRHPEIENPWSRRVWQTRLWA